MKISYDKNADCMYIYFTSEKVDKTLHISDNINIDLDSKGNLRGIEIVYFSEKHSIYDLNNIRIENARHEEMSVKFPAFV